MPTSGTGNANSGFTLPEVLAVLVLIGLISTLAFPDFYRGVEKKRVALLGELIQNDLSRVREEAIAARTNGTLCFANNGYYFTIGETEIRRTFKNFRVAPEKETDPKLAIVAPAEPNPTGPGDAPVSGVAFDAEGRCLPQQFHWETQYYQGIVAVTDDGRVTWRCTLK